MSNFTLEEAKKKNNSMNILVLTNKDKVRKLFEKLISQWERFFFVKCTFNTPENISKYTNSTIHVLFLEATAAKVFDFAYYEAFKRNANTFAYISIVNNKQSKNPDIYKNLVDQMVNYENPFDLVAWNTIAILRRNWSLYHKPTTIIYKSIIIDFVDRVVKLNGKPVTLTTKQFDLLRYLMENKGQYVTKKKLLMSVWGHDDDSSRILDQMIFKLKSKIGDENFHSSRDKGIKFE